MPDVSATRRDGSALALGYPQPGVSEAQWETLGEMRAAISTRIVGLLREHYGRGPSRAKTYAMDDCIVCVLRNGFTPHERTIVEGGDPGRVIEMRQDFQRLMERKYRETI